MLVGQKPGQPRERHSPEGMLHTPPNTLFNGVCNSTGVVMSGAEAVTMFSRALAGV